MKKYLLLLAFLFVTFTQTTFPMAAGINRWATRISIGAYLFPYIQEVTNSFLYNHDLKCRDVNSETDNFVRKTLLKAGYSSDMVDKINIKTGPQRNYSSNSIHKTIDVPEKLEEILENNKYSVGKSQDYLLAQGVLIHEGAHIYHNDLHAHVAAGISIPLLIQGISLGSGKLMMGMFNRPFYLLRALAKLYIGLPLKHYGYFETFNIIAQFEEKRADLEVIKRVKDPEILRACANDFEKSHSYHYYKNDEIDYIPQHRIPHALHKHAPVLRYSEYPRPAYFFIDPRHPYPLQRAEPLKKALKEL